MVDNGTISDAVSALSNAVVSSKNIIKSKGYPTDNNLADLEKIEAISVSKKEEDNKGETVVNRNTTLAKKVVTDNDNVNSEDFSEVTTVENIIQDLCNELAEDGLLTASEYRRNLTLLEKT